MAYRCDCEGKFVSVEQGEPEATLDIEDGSVTGTVRMVLVCTNCGNELAESEQELSADIDHTCAEDAKINQLAEDEPEFELIDTSAEAGDSYQTTDDKGKPISPRYQKHFYAVDVSATVKCMKCDEEFTVSIAAEEQASNFNSLV